MNYILSQEARDDLLDIDGYIASENPTAAGKIFEEIFTALEKLARRPAMGHTRPDLTSWPVRFWPVRSYLIIYDPDTDPIAVVRVLSGYRDVAELLS